MKLTMQLGSRSYDIILKSGCLANLYQFANVANRKVFILTDSGVPEQYAQTVLAQCPNGMVYTVPQGEASKSLKVYGQVLQAMLEFNMTRKDLLVAVGGGVVGDLGGFCAASYMRGIDFVNCPTTTLSQIDSSIGGKTAIDLGETKNIVGAFWQPKVVLVDFDALATLPRRHFVNGLAEAIKAGLIADPELFALFECEHPEENIERIIYRSLRVKKNVVENDEHEQGQRACLNFGHTIGHGIEAVKGVRGRRTNGLFHVEYDPDALALVSVNPGAVLNRYDTSTAGKIRMGYADANEINGVIANLVFRYTPGDEVEETDLILSVVEDGATSAGTTEAVKITLPEDPFPERFEDVQKGDWFYDDVKFVYNQGLMVGVSETRFAPNATANRAMIATVLYRLAGTPTYTTENPYTDLKQGSYYYDAVLWCTENGIFEGYGNGKFGPMDAVTREQLAVVLYRYTEKYLDMDASSRVVLKDVYRDYEKISRWAEDGMSWASATGLMEGYPDGTVRPRNGEKRSEIAAMFHRYCVNILDV